MQLFYDAVLRSNGSPAVGAEITVTTSDGEPAILYEDNGLTPYPSNVLTANDTGEYSFFATNGTYNIVVRYGTFPAETRSGVVLYDPQDDATRQLGSELTASGGADLVGFVQGGTGAIAQTVQDKARQVVSVLDFMTAAERAAILSGLSAIDHAPAVQKADTYLDSIGGGVLEFPAGAFRFATPVLRSPRTSWQGVGGGLEASLTSGTRIYGAHDGVLVSVGAANINSIYCRNVFTRGLHFVGDLFSYPNATAMRDRLVRQRVYEDITITSFRIGHETVTCGEFYRERMFISGCRWSRYDSSLSDSWATNCHFGSGISTVPAFWPILSGGSGVFCFASTTLTEVGCRYQVQYQGHGGTFIGCQGLRLVAPIADGNDGSGLMLEGCRDVDITSPRLYSNGVTTVGTSQIVVRTRTATCTFTPGNSTVSTGNADINIRFISAVTFVTDGSLPPELAVGTTYFVGSPVTGTTFTLFPTYDDAFAGTNKITPSTAGVGNHSVYLVSDKIRIVGGSSRSAGSNSAFLGFQQVASSGALSASASLGAVTVDGHDVTQVSSPYGSLPLGASGLTSRARPRLGPVLTADAAGITVFPELGYKAVTRTAALAADVTIALTPTATQGDRVTFYRSSTATGAFNWLVQISGATVATLGSAGTSAEFIGSAGSWVRVS